MTDTTEMLPDDDPRLTRIERRAAEWEAIVAERDALKAAVVELDAAEFAYARFTRDEGIEKHRQNRERRIAAWQAARKLVGLDT